MNNQMSQEEITEFLNDRAEMQRLGIDESNSAAVMRYYLKRAMKRTWWVIPLITAAALVADELLIPYLGRVGAAIFVAALVAVILKKLVEIFA